MNPNTPRPIRPGGGYLVTFSDNRTDNATVLSVDEKDGSTAVCKSSETGRTELVPIERVTHFYASNH